MYDFVKFNRWLCQPWLTFLERRTLHANDPSNYCLSAVSTQLVPQGHCLSFYMLWSKCCVPSPPPCSQVIAVPSLLPSAVICSDLCKGTLYLPLHH